MLVALLPRVGTAIPQKIIYQGFLTNAAGVPINGTLQMVFSIYNVPSSGTPLWKEHQGVAVINGICNVSLGDTVPIPLTLDVPYYLGITVGGDPEMMARKPLTSVGHAFRAMTADVVGAHTHGGADIKSGTVAEPRIDSAIARSSAPKTPDAVIRVTRKNADAIHAYGDLYVTGAHKGGIGPNSGDPFPRPAYDSGWINLSGGGANSPGESGLTLDPGLPAASYNSDNFFVEMTGRGATKSGPPAWTYQINTDNTIQVWNYNSAISQIRIRVWYIK
jgi:hypothetical protein